MKKQIKSQEEKHISKEEKVLLDQSLDDFKRGKTISHKKMMEFLKGSQPQEEWEKEFLDEFAIGNDRTTILAAKGSADRIIDFITNLISKEREKIKKTGISFAQSEIPMGVSQWKNHGIKYGYWELLISKIRKEERELIIRIIEEEKEVIFNSEKFYNGGEEVFGLLLKIQEKIKHL